MDIAEMMRAMRENGDNRPKISREGQVARLYEAADRFITQPKFSVNDLVTPRADSSYRGAGDPHLVVETNYDSGALFMVGEDGSNAQGRHLNIRVLSIESDTLRTHWVEAAEFEPYTGPLAMD